MHRLLALSRSRPPFPSSFFTQSSASTSSARSRGGLQNFSDSSRSRPPPSSRNRGGSGSGSGNPAKRPESKAATAKAQKGESIVGEDGIVKESDIKASSSTRIGGRTSRTRSAPSSSSQTGTSSTPSTPAPWKPQSFIPLPILGAPPVQITQDAFYSGHRPLLEVTLSQNRRLSVSASDRKLMDIVGEDSEEAEAMELAEASSSLLNSGSPSWDEGPGEWDSYLVTEPEGADPRWSDGTDKYLAALEHNIPPPVPSSSSSFPAVTEAATEKSNKKPIDKRREDIDYLFPIQAARRRSEEYERRLAEEESITAPSRIPAHRLKPNTTHSNGSSASAGAGFDTVYTTNGDLNSASPGVKFLVSQLVKNQWSGLWDFEAVRKALQAASTSTTKMDKVNASPIKAVERLSLASRKQAKLQRSKMSKKGSRGGMKPGMLEKMLTEALEGTGAQVTIVTMGSDGSMVSRQLNEEEENLVSGQETSKSSSAAAKSLTSSVTKEEVRQVIREVERFKGFFDKSVDDSEFPHHNLNAALTKAAAAAAAAASENYPANAAEAAHRRLEKRFGPSSAFKDEQSNSKDAVFEVEWEGGASLPSTSSLSSSSSSARLVDASELDWVTDSLPSSETIDARFSLAGPRVLQARRGRSLNRTLRERLGMRGIHLVGSRMGGVEMDSVKRKRRRRISKHKYKKRRKATRAERRRTGK